jgi:hypothetical protein
LGKLTYTFRQKNNLETKKEIKIPEYIMSNSDIIIIFKPEQKENLILRQIYYPNTSSNINNEMHSIILKLNLIIGVNKKNVQILIY